MKNIFKIKKRYAIESMNDIRQAIKDKHGDLLKASIYYKIKYQTLQSILSTRQKANTEQVEIICNDLKLSREIFA